MLLTCERRNEAGRQRAKSKTPVDARRLEALVANVRPLGEVTLVGDPALFVRAHGVVDVGAPGHVGKHFEQVFHLVGRQRTVSVLRDTERVTETVTVEK